MPFALGGLVNSPGEPAGQVNASRDRDRAVPGESRSGTTGTVTNTALIDPDGPGPLAADQPVGGHPGDAAGGRGGAKTGPASAIAGTNVVFTITVTNHGPSSRANVVLDDATPPGLTFVSNGGDCTSLFPCSFGTLASGATRTVTATFFVPPGYTTPDPIVNLATRDEHDARSRARQQHGAGGGQPERARGRPGGDQVERGRHRRGRDHDDLHDHGAEHGTERRGRACT